VDSIPRRPVHPASGERVVAGNFVVTLSGARIPALSENSLGCPSQVGGFSPRFGYWSVANGVGEGLASARIVARGSLVEAAGAPAGRCLSRAYSPSKAFHNFATAPRLTGRIRLTEGSTAQSNTRSGAFVILASQLCISGAELCFLGGEVAMRSVRGVGTSLLPRPAQPRDSPAAIRLVLRTGKIPVTPLASAPWRSVWEKVPPEFRVTGIVGRRFRENVSTKLMGVSCLELIA